MFNEKGELQRPASQFRNWISSEAGAKYPPEKGRYHLYVSYACPWGKSRFPSPVPQTHNRHSA
jgi:glutathionyl-hydroquinone reductase